MEQHDFGANPVEGERADTLILARIGPETNHIIMVQFPRDLYVPIDGGREDKIAAIGVRVRRWVTYHGIAINVEPELEHFSGIVPCGIRGHGVTSLVDLGLPVTMVIAADGTLERTESFDAPYPSMVHDFHSVHFLTGSRIAEVHAFAGPGFDVIRVVELHDRRMIGFGVGLDRPVHARGEVVLVGGAPAPDRRVVGGVPLAVVSQHLVLHVGPDRAGLGLPGLRVVALRSGRGLRRVELVAATPAAPFRMRGIVQSILQEIEPRWRVPFFNGRVRIGRRPGAGWIQRAERAGFEALYLSGAGIAFHGFRSAGGRGSRGAQLVAFGTCIGCHTVKGSATAIGKTAPDLTHVGSRLTIGGGLYPNDKRHMMAWIKNSRALKPGSLMPTLGIGQYDPILRNTVGIGLNDQQIADIVAYLQALK